ncbi:MAG: hypothetical protein HY847_04635 [Betaproteobacteria bacterium]|nr:hypothetical protein [Betaproteobacteria bacterium]
MPIHESDIVWRPASLVSDTLATQNGGRMAYATIVSGVKNNLFGDVSQAERTAGSVRRRKAFVHINSSQDIALMSARLFLDALTPAADYVTFSVGTPTDTEDQIAGRDYGIGTLYAPSAAGDSQIQVVCEHNGDYATLQPFQADDTLRVADRAVTGGSGNEEFVAILAVTYGPDYATIEFEPALAFAYGTANTLVSSVCEIAEVAGGLSNIAITSAAGTLTTTGGNLTAHNRGAIAEQWTITFTSPTAFTVAGVVTGALATAGSRSADYSPLNPATGTAYFTLKSAAFGGTWAADDTVSFETAPAAIPVWYRRRVPAGSGSFANDFCSLAIVGESA